MATRESGERRQKSFWRYFRQGLMDQVVAQSLAMYKKIMAQQTDVPVNGFKLSIPETVSALDD